MKRFVIIFLLMFLFALPANTEESLDTAIKAVRTAPSPDEQLSLLHALSVAHAQELENREWTGDLDIDIAGDIPEDCLPDKEHAEKIESLPEQMREYQYVAMIEYLRTTKWLGSFYVLLPENMRARTLEEADAVIYLRRYYMGRSDYIGAANDQHYDLYVVDRVIHKTYLIYEARTTPPVSGRGPLYGADIPLDSIWRSVRGIFAGELKLECDGGTALFQITGNGCCLTGLEGAFTRFDIPAEVEGYRVTAVSGLASETLEALTLPEGIIDVRLGSCPALKEMNFPSTLRRLGGLDNTGIRKLDLNEGLEEISGGYRVRPSSITLPSTLKHIEKSFLEDGADVATLILPESLTYLPDFCLYQTRKILAIYVPASITDIGGNDFASTGCTRIFTPENSEASEFIFQKSEYNSSVSVEWCDCERPEDMPEAYYYTEGDFLFGILGDEAFLLEYTGDAEDVVIPETADGRPVTEIDTDAFRFNYSIVSVHAPSTLKKIHSDAFGGCDNLQDLYIPGGTIFTTDYSAPMGCNIHRAEIEREEIHFSGLSKNDIIEFGRYEQDMHRSNGPEPIEWIVLDTDGETATLISRYGLASKPVHGEWYVDVAWDSCDLRSWLNDDFLNEAFSREEQAFLLETTVKADPNPEYESETGGDTTDRVYLLSVEEAQRYFDSDESRITRATRWARARGVNGNENSCFWWLRTTGDTAGNICYVWLDGEISLRGDGAAREGHAIRPVIRIRIDE